MPLVVRKGDVCSGHGCFPPRVSSSWSSNVFINSLPVERNRDSLVSHCCGDPCHIGNWVGTRSVYANGLNIQTVGDPIDCGSVGSASSPNVSVE